MRAELLLSIQFACIIIIMSTASMIFANILATTLFTAAFAMFISCSIYIEKNRSRLMKECQKKK